MNTDRIDGWVRKLPELLSEAEVRTPRKGIVYLIQHLEGYIQRWVGFSTMKDIGVSGTLHTDLFCIIIGAVRVVNILLKEMTDAGWFPSAEWQRFENSLDYIADYPKLENLDLVTDAFDRLWQAYSWRDSEEM